MFSSTAPQSPVIFDPQQHLVIRLRDLVKRAILQKCPGGSGSGNGGRTSSSKGNNNIKSVGGATTAELMAILGDDLVDMFTLKAVDDLVNENGNFVDSIGGYRRVGSSGNRSRNHNSIGSTYGALPDR